MIREVLEIKEKGMLTFEDETVQSEKLPMNGTSSDVQMMMASRPGLTASRVTNIRGI